MRQVPDSNSGSDIIDLEAQSHPDLSPTPNRLGVSDEARAALLARGLLNIPSDEEY